MVENGRKRIKMKTITENITAAFVCSIVTEFNVHHNVQSDHFWYTKTHTCLRSLGEYNKRNVLFIADPQDDFFCFIPPSLAAKYELKLVLPF